MALTGYRLDPSDSDLVRVFELSASGCKPPWVRDVNVYSEHPTILFVSSKPAVDTKQIHIVWGPLMFGDKLERPVSGAVWRQSGNPVPIIDSGLEIGSYKNFQLWQSGNSTPWVLREFQSSSADFKDTPYALYTLCYRSDSYVRAFTQMTKAAANMEKASSPLKPSNIISPVTPKSTSCRTRVWNASGSRSRKPKRETYIYPGDVEKSSIQTRSQARELIKAELITAAIDVLTSGSRPSLTEAPESVEEMSQSANIEHLLPEVDSSSGKQLAVFTGSSCQYSDLSKGKELVLFAKDSIEQFSLTDWNEGDWNEGESTVNVFGNSSVDEIGESSMKGNEIVLFDSASVKCNDIVPFGWGIARSSCLSSANDEQEKTVAEPAVIEKVSAKEKTVKAAPTADPKSEDCAAFIFAGVALLIGLLIWFIFYV